MKMHYKIPVLLATLLFPASLFAAEQSSNSTTTPTPPSATSTTQSSSDTSQAIPSAQNPGETMRERWENMTPEQKEAMKEKIHEKREDFMKKRSEEWQKMTPEQKTAIKERMQKKWNSMSDQEKQMFREETQMREEVMK